MEEKAFLFLLGSVLVLTQHEIGPLSLHRPLILGMIGFFCFDLPREILFPLSLTLELFWLDRIPAGAQRIPALSFGTWTGVLGVYEMKNLSSLSPEPLFLFSLIFSLSAMIIFVPVDGGVRRVWNRITDSLVLQYIQSGSYPFWVTLGSFLFRLCIHFFLFFLGDRGLVWFLMREDLFPFMTLFSGFPTSLLIPALVFAFLLRERGVLRELSSSHLRSHPQ